MARRKLYNGGTRSEPQGDPAPPAQKSPPSTAFPVTRLEWCFLNFEGDLRSGWKFAAYVVLLIVFWVVGGIAVGSIFELTGNLVSPFVNFALNMIVNLTAAAGATVFLARTVDRVPASSFVGFTSWAANFGKGIGIGALLLTILLAAFAAFGDLAVAANFPQFYSHLMQAIMTIVLLSAGAAFEELTFRGYAMQSLAVGIGRWPAAAVTAVLFGVLHLRNPHASALGIINTVLAGLLLSGAYYKVRSLWLPFGIHVAWNVGLGMVAGFPVSGLSLDTLWIASSNGSSTLTGGDYGPEGGLFCTMAFAAGFATIHLVRPGEAANAPRLKKKI